MLAVKVSTLVVFVGFVPKDAVRPDPIPVAERVTLPVKPPVGCTVIELVPREPRVTLRFVGEAERVKFAGAVAVTVSETVVVCVIPPPFPVMVIA